MITGYNTDTKFGGVVYHVQTEDGGAENPFVVTLVYRGGRILASKKTSYSGLLGAPDLITKVRTLLEKQHRMMLAAVNAGMLAEGGKLEAQAAASLRTDGFAPPAPQEVPREAKPQPAKPGAPRQFASSYPPPGVTPAAGKPGGASSAPPRGSPADRPAGKVPVGRPPAASAPPPAAAPAARPAPHPSTPPEPGPAKDPRPKIPTPASPGEPAPAKPGGLSPSKPATHDEKSLDQVILEFLASELGKK